VPRTARLLRLYAGVHRGLFLALLGAIGLSGVLAPAFVVATGALAAAVAGGAHVWAALAVVGALFVAQRLLGPALEEIAQTLARRVDDRVTERLMAAVSAPPGLAHLEDPSVLDAIARAEGVLDGATPGGAVSPFAWVSGQRIQGVLSLALVLSWRWWAAAVLGAAFAGAFVASRWHWNQITRIVYGRTGALRRATYVRGLALKARAAKETRVFGLASWLVDGYRARWLAVMRGIWSKRREGWLIAVGVYLGVAGAEAVVVAEVAAGAAAGALPLGRAVTLVGAVLAAGILAVFGDNHGFLADAAVELGNLEAMERAAGRVGGVVGGVLGADDRPQHAIRFEGVRFVYPGQDRPVFAALDLDIPAGRSLAIVGENGAGKTTLVKLLARLHDPDAGRITVDGVDLRQVAPTAWHRRVAAIFQDFTRFELTAFDNVAFGALHRAGDRAAVARAAELAGAGGIIARLPRGWDTPLTRQVEGGTQLSDGEWQRLALARALFAVQAGAGVLVLDEPTASLDVRGEAEVYERFLELTRGVTTIVISHRFSTVRRADRIVVLEHGRVVEDGSHDELVAAAGRYAAMYRLQAARFSDA
jgi:ATP-binding cassette subfamily B protein